MNKRMREIQAEILELSKEASALTKGEEKDIEKASALLDKADELQKEFETLDRLEKAEKARVQENASSSKAVDAIKAFADAARAGFKNLNETTGADGGYTVPEDISTLINRFREEHFSLASLVDRETVTTNAGRRTYKTRAQHTGFSRVAEAGNIGKVNPPQFSILEYAIKKYAGYMPVTNELLEDSDANIANIMAEWLAAESVATENAQILALVNNEDAVELAGLNGIKTAINVTLSAFKGTVKIITNSDGLNYLDTLEDNNGRPLLSPDPVKPMEAWLSVGVRRIPVIEVPNDVMPSDEDTGAIPFVLGDLYEFVKQFDRKQLTLTTSNVASVTGFNAYEQDFTLVRAIMRGDWQVKDSAAIVRGTITPEAAEEVEPSQTTG